ncbi:hypothetical protein PINS_up019341 [Pythium insidiosum]|nr:hypothetical protein PINS_up001599 [Pythium insidiosum]GLE08290.1 hypothetical protein PINS_up019341 [Pythium insidiosum]
MLKKVVVAAMQQEVKQRDDGNDAKQSIFRQFAATLAMVFAPNDRDRDVDAPADSHASSSVTTNGDSSVENDSHVVPVVTREQVIVPALGGRLLSLALVLPDVQSMIQKILRVADATSTAAPDAARERHREIAFRVWSGYCARTRSLRTVDGDSADKMRLRLRRLCLDFALGISYAGASQGMDSQASAMPSFPTDSLATDASTSTGASCNAAATTPLRVRWHLRLLHTAISDDASPAELRGLVLHPKSRIAWQLWQRVRTICALEPTCQRIVDAWSHDGVQDVRIDFSNKGNTVACVLLYLLLAFASMLHEISREDLNSAWREYVGVVQILRQCVEGEDMEAFGRFNDRCCRAIELLVCDNGSSALSPQQFVDVCLAQLIPSEERPSNAAALLEAHHTLVVSPTNALEIIEDADAAKASLESANTRSGACLSSDPGSVSPCLLSNVPASDGARLQQQQQQQLQEPKPRTASAPIDLTSSPEPASTSSAAPFPQTPTRPARSSIPPKAVGTPSKPPPSGSLDDPTASIFPSLIGCKESITHVRHHFPIGFRSLFPLLKIQTIGDLSALSFQEVKIFGMKEPIATVLRALEEFQSKSSRARQTIPNSPFRRQLQSPVSLPSPAVFSSSSPSRTPKRSLLPSAATARLVSPLPVESPHRKRARRSLRELTDDREPTAEAATSASGATGPSDATPQPPKIADRVTFCLDAGGGETKISRPGEDSQDGRIPMDMKEKEDEEDPEEAAQERMHMYSVKLHQHLRRSVYYAEKIVAEEQNVQSESSLRTGAEKSRVALGEAQRALALAARVTEQLNIVCESRGSRCGRLLQRGSAEPSKAPTPK